jgi:hypothetical protein
VRTPVPSKYRVHAVPFVVSVRPAIGSPSCCSPRPHPAHEIDSIDFFTVPTATFRVFFVFLVSSSHRRRILHLNVTTNPSAAWTGHEIVDAFPWDSAPSYLLRDRDGICGNDFVRRVKGMGIEEVPISARSSPAEPLCGACDWLAPEGVPRSSDHLQRKASPMRTSRLFRVLPRIAHSARIGEGLPGSLGGFSRPNWGPPSKNRWPAGCVIGTTVKRPDRHRLPLHSPSTVALSCFPPDRNRAVEIAYGHPSVSRLSSSARDQSRGSWPVIRSSAG